MLLKLEKLPYIPPRVKRRCDNELVLTPTLSGVHPIFHVSMLQKHHADRSHVLDSITVQLYESIGYEEETIVIVDRQVRQLRSKKIYTVKVQWRGQPIKEVNWETGEDMRSRYSHLFGTSEYSLFLWSGPNASAV
uniref:Uncharacterized protein LOC104229837 n=1 Tax=Nicotiana sylvestris TaxID=4096 RepID=A0A1U7WU82_NICSY|nr:PREDICTED: uncharacterized protein LOC104229837 [Nicotiana sylvestris]